MLKSLKLLGMRVDIVTMNETIAYCKKIISSKQFSHIVTVNTEMIMQAQKNKKLAEIINKAYLAIPDGAGVVLAAKYYGHSIYERVTGFDLAKKLFTQAIKEKYRLFFLGATKEIIEKAKINVENNFPGILICGCNDGYFIPKDNEKIIEKINQVTPDILLVGLGVPKQEFWISNNADKLKISLAIGVGGTFDILAKTAKRAPLWMQNIHLEWFYRLIKEPYRFKRVLTLPKFVLAILKNKKNGDN